MSLKLVGDNFDYSDCIAYNFEFWIPNFTKSFNVKMFLILNIIFLFVYGIMICLWLIPIINLLKLKLEKISKFCIITHKQEYKEMNIYIYIYIFFFFKIHLSGPNGCQGVRFRRFNLTFWCLPPCFCSNQREKLLHKWLCDNFK